MKYTEHKMNSQHAGMKSEVNRTELSNTSESPKVLWHRKFISTAVT